MIFAQDRQEPSRKVSPFREPSPLVVVNTANGRGIIAPDCAATVKGEGFIEETTFPPQSTYPTELAGVSVKISGQLARIRGIFPNQILIIVPDLGWSELPATDGEVSGSAFVPRLSSWRDVEVTTPRGVFKTLVATANVSPGIYEQNGQAQGLARFEDGPIGIISINPVIAGSRLSLLGTGLIHARKIQVYFDGSAAVADAEASKYPSFPWVEAVWFDLPKDLHGDVKFILQVDGQWSNPVMVRVE